MMRKCALAAAVRRLWLLLPLGAALLAGCASSTPRQSADLCSLFEDRRSWYKAAVRSQERWGVPLHVSMAFIQHESAFEARAKPERQRLLGFIPWTRPSSAYGYAQALDGTWSRYRREAHNFLASRASFADAMDFVGWYNHNSYRRNGIARDDASSLYLAYHEGHGGYARGTYRNKPELLAISRQVQASADRYRIQFERCEAELGRNWFLRLLF